MEKSVKQPIELISTRWTEDSWREAVEDFCEANNLQVPELGSSRSYELTQRLVDEDVEEFFDNLDDCKAEHDTYMITGTLGLWYGKVELTHIPVRDSLKKSINGCLGRDIEDYQINLMPNGVIQLIAMHHDGRNYFEIRKLGNRVPKKVIDCVGKYYDGEVRDYWFEKIKIEDIFNN